MEEVKKKYGEICACGYPREITEEVCPCGDLNCSKTGSDGSLCKNPYHSQDI